MKTIILLPDIEEQARQWGCEINHPYPLLSEELKGSVTLAVFKNGVLHRKFLRSGTFTIADTPRQPRRAKRTERHVPYQAPELGGKHADNLVVPVALAGIPDVDVSKFFC